MNAARASASPEGARPPGRLRVAFVADTVHGRIGGGITSADRFVSGLRRHHDVTVIGADATAGDGVRLRGFMLPIHAMRTMGFVMAKPDRKAIARAIAASDVVHLQFPFWLSFVALEEARRARKPVIAAFHVQPENALLNVGISSAPLTKAVYRFWVDRLYGKADAVVCPTKFAEAKLRSYGLEAPTIVISNGIPPDVTALALTTPAPAPAGAGDPFVIMTAGRFAKEKRQADIIEAVRRCRHAARVQLVIAGDGPEKETLTRLARQLPRPAQVGFLPREQLLERLRSADLYVHASEVELEGIAVLEAIGSGVPALIAVSPESAASELAIDDAFRFTARNVDELAARLDALIESPSERARARELYAARAAELDFERSLSKLSGLYAGVVSTRA